MVYVPEGCAHGFLTIEDETEVLYQMSEFYNVESARGVRWNDPAFQILWPEKVEVISDRDRTYPNFDKAWIS
jgi:dTDP-4-dehydrorhamnose 3,5-epimerase